MTKAKAAFDHGYLQGEQISPDMLKAALELWAQAGETHYIPLHGTSMLPLLRDGDQVLVSHIRDQVQVGDIVVFQRDDGLIAHRVLRVSPCDSGGYLRTKGDHVQGLDPEMSEGEVVGRVLAIRRDARLMRVDSSGWRAFSKLIATVMLLQAWFYHKAGKAGGKMTARLAMIFSRGLLKLGLALVGGCQAFLGRWQKEGNPITG